MKKLLFIPIMLLLLCCVVLASATISESPAETTASTADTAVASPLVADTSVNPVPATTPESAPSATPPVVEIVGDTNTGTESLSEKSIQPQQADETPVAPVSAFRYCPSIGLNGRATFGEAFGKPPADQSLWGFTARYMYPTGKNSVVRLTAGVPLGPSAQTRTVETGRIPYDFYAAIDHEWGFDRFGMGLGLYYMYMHAFSRTAYSYDYNYASNRTINNYVRAWYPSVNSTGNMLNIRIGSPQTGFRGHVVWPWAFMLQNSEPKSIYFEYSAIGAFPLGPLRMGAGFEGKVLSRDATYADLTNMSTGKVTRVNNTGSDVGWSAVDGSVIFSGYEADNVSTVTYAALLPVIKSSLILFGKTSLTLSIELGNILIPRPGEWVPGFSIDYVVGFRPLRYAGPMDGTF